MSKADENDYEAERDADTLQRHAEITADPERHKKAHAKLKEKAKTTNQAAAQSGRMMRRKVKDGLSKAFPNANQADTDKDDKDAVQE